MQAESPRECNFFQFQWLGEMKLIPKAKTRNLEVFFLKHDRSLVRPEEDAFRGPDCPALEHH